MKTKYYKYTLKGDHSAEDALRQLGEAASEGYIVRIDKARGETHVYFASSAAKKATKSPDRKEVSESAVRKLY